MNDGQRRLRINLAKILWLLGGIVLALGTRLLKGL